MVLLNSPQTVSQRHTTTSNITSDDSVSVSYDSQGSFSDHLTRIMEQTETVFEAIQLADEINTLNGYGVVSQYDIRKIKDMFKNKRSVEDENRNIKNEKTENGIVKNKVVDTQIAKNRIGNLEKEISKTDSSKVINMKKQLTKGYMSLLTNQLQKC